MAERDPTQSTCWKPTIAKSRPCRTICRPTRSAAARHVVTCWQAGPRWQGRLQDVLRGMGAAPRRRRSGAAL